MEERCSRMETEILTPVFLLLLWTGAGRESWGSGDPPHWWAWWWGEDGRGRPRPPSPCSYDKIRETETMNAEAGARGRRPRDQTRGWTRRTTGGWSSGRAGRTGCRRRGCRTSTEMGWRLDLEVLNLVYWAVETLLENCSRTPWYWTHVCGQHIGTGSQVLIFTTLMFISEETRITECLCIGGWLSCDWHRPELVRDWTTLPTLHPGSDPLPLRTSGRHQRTNGRPPSRSGDNQSGGGACDGRRRC